ncbi:metallophosphoesterase family protein [Fimbriimonas ginsengisoli]|uniref:Calcineurin-like phosphoesterase domain-containing protein n=1 Tax=Fimbriimonas ginsengisoli Gsoil 348 TaxID=661478 RepID=A0A068NQ56_FIMGI|nr:metallophosphoesterase [Fimbriimonas ginsengisoli]AIE85497.1 hypothetical protein OP10G_2129 [Fimbriimonas ginsengisoli Gsoil 348]
MHHVLVNRFRLASSAAFVALAATAGADTWTFVVAGDGRTNDKTPDFSGINLPILNKMVTAIKAEHPRFMLFTGDLVHGVYGLVKAPVDEQLDRWKKAVAPLYGVAIYPVRGNHETYGDKDGKIWMSKIKPIIDAGNVSYFKGEEGYSYSFATRDKSKTVVIAVDQFIHEHRVNLDELKQTLEKARKARAKNIFVFAHEMAFTCTAHGDDENMSKFKEDRDKFLDLLQRYSVRYFFAGHDHAYDWMEIRTPRWPSNYTLNQIVAGTAGAPFYTDKGYFGDHGAYELKRKEHKDSTYGYLLVTVDDKKGVTVTFKEIPQ